MKYLVTADTATMPYSTSCYLFGIFDTEEEALDFIKKYKPKKKRTKKHECEDSPDFFDFQKSLGVWIKEKTEEEIDSILKQYFISEFDEKTPLFLNGYYE